MRVSTEDQAREGFSLPEQKERLESFLYSNAYGRNFKYTLKRITRNSRQ